MHFYMVTRGVKDVVDRYINDLLAYYSRWSSTIPGGTDQVVQLQMRPIQLWECVFPESDAEKVMRVICPVHGWDERPSTNAFAALLRKLLRVGKRPKKFDFPKGTPRGIPSSKFVSVTPIGMKKDVFKKGIEQL